MALKMTLAEEQRIVGGLSDLNDESWNLRRKRSQSTDEGERARLTIEIAAVEDRIDVLAAELRTFDGGM